MKNLQKLSLIVFVLALFSTSVNAQILTKEDSLSAGLTGRKSSFSMISGYGEVKVSYDQRFKTGTANLTRNVLFFGHKFSNNVYFFSEMELEDAKVSDETSGEISMEQLFIKFNINPANYITAGLFIPRIGLINENHLPTTFNGNDRPFVERLVIPATWREIGIGYYGTSRSIRGLNYSAGIMNGLNSKKFEFGNGIRDGRMAGSNATASNIAVTGALLYYIGNFRIQVSTYYGGSSGLDQIDSDTLNLPKGMFAVPISLSEANVRYNSTLFEFKALASVINIKDASKINSAYNSNTPEQITGAYFEAGLHILHLFNPEATKDLTLFSRIEKINLNAKVAENGVKDDFQDKTFSVTGLTFSPVKGVVIKADYVWRKTGNFNNNLHNGNPYSSTRPFYNTNQFFNIGLGYSF